MVHIYEVQNTGNLIVSVYNGSVAVPVANAQVIVTNPENGQILYNVFTAQDGETVSMSLPAPPLSYSAEENELQPYSVYDTEIIAEGFKSVLIRGVQIFPDTTALQAVYIELGSGEEQIITISPPVLWENYPEKIPENEVKPIPEETGFVVLDRVVIPEYIAIHNGSPGTNGTIYYVPYKDYIKNVASAEIYSTWEDAAIRANVLAINSFTLNRVFTEWYRSRGYDFTITNSTEYVKYP